MKGPLFLSVVRSWRFAGEDDQPVFTVDPASWKASLRRLQAGEAPVNDFTLPWPPFPSHFWHFTLKTPCRSTPAHVLVRMLVPLRTMLGVEVVHQCLSRRPLVEIFVLPFGVWTTLTLTLSGEFADDRELADTIADTMDSPITRAGAALSTVRKGIEPEVVAGILDVPWRDVPNLIDSGSLVLTSGLCAVGTAVQRAPQFRSQFLGGAGGTVQPFTRTEGASATTSGQIGLVLADTSRSASKRVKCLHHNHSLLAGHMLALSALVVSGVGANGRLYRELAALYLNHLYRGDDVLEAGIYKSRVAPAWLVQKNLLVEIDAATAYLAHDIPPKLVPEKPKVPEGD